MSSVGERLRQLRVAKGVSQTELARDLVSPSYVSLIEANKRTPEREVLEELAKRLGASVEFLETGVDAAELQEKQLAVRYAELALANGQVTEALQQFKALASSSLPQIRHQAAWGTGRALEAQGDITGAIKVVEGLLEEAVAGRVQAPGFLVLRNQQCWLYREAGDLGLSIELGERALQEVRDLGLEGTEDQIRLASTLVGSYWERGDLTKAHLLAEKVITQAERHGSPRSRGSAYWNASLVAEARGQRQLAIELAEKALALMGETMDDRGIVQMRAVLAWLLLRVDPPQVERAEQILASFQDLVLGAGDEHLILRYSTELGRIRLFQGRPAEALELASRMIERPYDGRPTDLVRALLLRAQARFGLEDPAAGSDCAAVADLLRGLSGQRRAAGLWRELAETLLTAGCRDEAMNAYRELADCLGARSIPTPSVVAPVGSEAMPRTTV